MNKPSKRDKLLEQYMPTVNVPFSTSRRQITKYKGTTLEEFYREVNAKNAKHPSQLYNNKDASEIEMLMRQTRKLIETKRRSGN